MIRLRVLAQVSVPQAGSQADLVAEQEEEQEQEVVEVTAELGEENKSNEQTAPGCNGTAMRQGWTW